MKHFKSYFPTLLLITLLLIGCNKIIPGSDTNSNPVNGSSGTSTNDSAQTTTPTTQAPHDTQVDIPFNPATIPEYSGSPYIEINNNKPYFSEVDLGFTGRSFTPFDELGRCGSCMILLSQDTLCNDERGPIGHIRPSGWHTVKYPELIEDLYLYNRCHLLGFHLSGENDNELNLITGTRYFNVEGMLPFENKVARYLYKNTTHVLYRVTPIFNQDDLVARGVLMEAYSVEDEGASLCFNVFIYNVQPGVKIDYTTGESTAY